MKTDFLTAIVVAVLGSGLVGSVVGWVRERRKDGTSIEASITSQANTAVDVMSKSIARLETDLIRVSRELLEAKQEIQKLENLLRQYEAGFCPACLNKHNHA